MSEPGVGESGVGESGEGESGVGQSDEAALRAATALVYVADLDELLLDPSDTHHLASVLRVAPHETIVACDGAGSWRTCTIDERGRPGRRSDPVARLVPTGPIVFTAPAARALTVGFALSKGDRTEWTVQKLTELGVDRIWPLISERTVVRLDASNAAKRGERLRRVAREAAAQSRRTSLPELANPRPLATVVSQLTKETGSGDGQQAVMAEPGGGVLGEGTSIVLVGPEGGWSATELSHGFELVGLGATVLRAETAAMVAGTLLVALRSGRVLPPV